MRFAQEDSDLSLHPEAALAADDRATGSGSATGKAQKGSKAVLTSDTLLAAILSSLDDDKAEEVVQIDLRGKTAIADHMVVCSGRSSRQVSSIADKLGERLKALFGLAPRVEGKDTGDWVLVDTGDVIVHIFRPEVREFYQLEKMWQPAPAAP